VLAVMNAANYRRRVIEAVVARLLALPSVRACFEGGSAATGRVDDFSDIDLMIVAPLHEADSAFGEVEKALALVGVITHRWTVDPPPFHETAQRVYCMAGAPPFFAVDCVVVAERAVGQFLETERHGEPLVYFDRTGTVRPRPADQATLAARRAKRWRQLRGAVPVYAMLVQKELTRGRPLEAFGFYQALLRALLEVLGVEHRPDRFDFGWRYVETQLPDEAKQRVSHYSFVPDASALGARAAELANELAGHLTRSR
jgi:hypothetical protein